jgi:hypothetical protein
MDKATRQTVLELFERHRASPGTPFDEKHFVDFLLAKPKGVRAAYDSFAGLRRFNRFIDDVQYEFGVCFSMSDREAVYSVDKFVARINELQQSRKGSLTSLKNQQNAGAGWAVIVLIDILLLYIALLFWNSKWVMSSFVLSAATITIVFAAFSRNDAKYLKRLRIRIEGAAAGKHAV